MPEPPETSSARRRASRKKSGPPSWQISRLTFLRLAAGAAGVGVGVAGAIGYQDLQAARTEQEFLQSLEIPDYQLPPEQANQFDNEGWNDSLPLQENFDAISVRDQTAIISRGMNTILEKMGTSVYPPFRTIHETLLQHWIVPGDGKIELRADAPKDGMGPAFALYPDAPLASWIYPEASSWSYVLVANGLPFDLSRIIPHGKIAPMNDLAWSLGLGHEILGHYALAKARIEFLRSQGTKDLPTIVEKVLNDPHTEPHAYAVQSALLNGLDGARINYDDLPNSLVEIANTWRAHSQSGGHWYDKAWEEAIHRFATQPTGSLDLTSHPTFPLVDVFRDPLASYLYHGSSSKT